MIVKRLAEFTDVLSKTVITNSNAITYEHQTAYNLIRLAIKGLYKTQGTLYLIGNGGSNAICLHAAADIVNNYVIKANTLSNPSLLTSISNDHGFDRVYSYQLVSTNPSDILIAVSSSGESDNIIKAVSMALLGGATVITFSGFHRNNQLRKLGKFNFWLDSTDYGIVEIGHSFLLHLLTDGD